VNGTTTINTANIKTSGNQEYVGAVSLTHDTLTTITSTATGNISFDASLDGLHNLVIASGGTTTFGGLVGNVAQLTNLSVTNTSGSTGSVAINTTAVKTVGSQIYTGAVTLGADLTLTSSNNQAITFASSIDGAHDLKTVTAALTTFGGIIGATPLTSLNVFSGPTAINKTAISTTGDQGYSGSVTLGSNSVLTTSTGNIVFSNTVDSVNLSTAFNLSATTGSASDHSIVFNAPVGGTAVLGNLTLTTGSLITAAIKLSSNSAISITTNSTSSYSSIGGAIQGVSVSLTKAGAGSLYLSGDSTYTGAVTVNAGTLVAGLSSTGAAGAVTSGPFGTGSVNVSGSTLDLNGKNISNVINLAGTGASGVGALINSSVSAAITNGAVALTADTTLGGTGDYTINGIISGAHALNFINTGIITLTNANIYSGGTNINASTTIGSTTLNGTVNLVNNYALPNGQVVTLNSGFLDINGQSPTIGSFTIVGGSIIDSGLTAGKLQASTYIVRTTSAATISVILAGNGDFTMSGSGTVILSKANTFTGTTTINAGQILILANGGILEASTGVIVNGTFDISQTSGTLIKTLSGTNGAGSVVLGGQILTLTAAVGSFPGVMTSLNTAGVEAHTGGIAITGGSETFTGTSTYYGTTTIGSGSTIALGSGGSISNSSSVIANGTFDISNSGGTSIVSLAGSGSGSHVLLGNMALTISNASNTFSGVLASTGSGGGIILTAGSDTFNIANTYSGLTT
jgi:autotransporter-associated beta strand protein